MQSLKYKFAILVVIFIIIVFIYFYVDLSNIDLLQGIDLPNNYEEHIVEKTRETKYSSSKKFFKNLEQHDNDRQNVHNTNIVNDLRKKYNKLIESFNEENKKYMEIIGPDFNTDEINKNKISETFRQIRQEIVKHYDGQKLNKIFKVLEEIEKGATIYSYTSDDNPVGEDWILALVWQRIHHQDNLPNFESLKLSLFDHLADCVQRVDPMVGQMLEEFFPHDDMYSIVCINGRVSRILSSLTLLDNDPILYNPEKDDKEVANIIYMRAYKILQDNIKLHNMEKIYKKDHNLLTSDEKISLEKFEKHVKDQINKILTEEYKGTFSEEKLKEIISKAQQGI